ncbi:dynein regulatory complex subunit 5 [Drosophila busckii]|uniref:dynein regulatory complex subunit 5 n=1 Tax=Drosophila busckii TaxID=30019 RepID=UPI001432B5AA|nr:dynein regulatory complex subunit 5 [Drosophila busckii]
MDDDNDDDYLPPVSTNTFAVPQESELLVEYELYRPSPACRRLRSEHKRGVYSEAFIENERLGTLADLCVRALAKLGTRYIAPQVRDDPSKLRIHYDALDVNLPLQDCYFVDDVHFWRRVVLAKSTDHALQLKRVDEYDWKGMGISLKYVELVEACSASYWPEERMAHLGQLVRQFVRTMHITGENQFFSFLQRIMEEQDPLSSLLVLTLLLIMNSAIHMERDYHKRHMNFSYDDMQRLARGLQTLKQLKVFRLRNSRMDSIKLLILARALKQLDELEMLDFGYDQLQDDCAVGLEMLLDRKQMIKALELEYNKLGQDSLVAIGTALKQHENDNPDGSPLEYLGLAHNPLNDLGIQVLVHNIVGTKHVQELNISGTECSPGTVAHELSNLLRRHAPLRRLDMVAIPLCPSTGRQLICGLEVNHKILHFDCRGCDLDLEQEFEADIIVRRNNYELQHSYLGDETQTEQSILEHLASIKHPIVAKLMADMERRAECIKERPTHSTTELSVEEEKEVEKEEEFDIWKMLGVRPPSIVVQDRVSVYASLNRSSIHRSGISFKYKPNEFNLDEFREHVDRLGPMDRHYYLQRQREY